MRFIITKNFDEMSKKGAELIIRQIRKKPDSILGLATGSTPTGLYKCLVEEHKKGLDFSKVKTFNLDEYYKLPPEHTQSYHYFMNQNLFNHINIDKTNVNIPNGLCEDVDEECRKYDMAISEAGGIDIQILGIGRNGHIGFNEPDDSLEVRTHLTNLTEDTIDANSRFFKCHDDVPKKAITMGLGTIMNANQIILLASGSDKADVISKISCGHVETSVPASVLNLHRNTIVIVDREAAMLLDLHSDLFELCAAI